MLEVNCTCMQRIRLIARSADNCAQVSAYREQQSQMQVCYSINVRQLHSPTTSVAVCMCTEFVVYATLNMHVCMYVVNVDRNRTDVSDSLCFDWYASLYYWNTHKRWTRLCNHISVAAQAHALLKRLHQMPLRNYLLHSPTTALIAVSINVYHM